MTYVVRALNGPLQGNSVKVTSRIIIGRGTDVDLQLLQKGVSRQHAAVLVDDQDTPFLMDLASKNGTFIGEASIGREELSAGTIFRIAETDFVLELGDSDPLTSQESDLQELRLMSGPAADATVQGMPVDMDELRRLAALKKSDS